MLLDIARVRFHYYIGKFTYENAKNIMVGEPCIVDTEEGREFGTIVTLKKGVEVEPKNIVKFDDRGQTVYEKDNGRNNDHDCKKRSIRVKNDINKIYQIARKANDEDIEKFEENKRLEDEAFSVCQEKISYHDLDMKLVSTHYCFDRSKLLFEFISDHRVDFRELVKDLASHFRTRIELRQIGVRDEAKIVGGCGICGRELCCNLMKNEFEAISIKMAKEQNMPLNTAKISGLCGRLMCCIHYEYETYRSIKRDLPKPGQRLTFNGSPAVIRDVNPLSKKILVQAEGERQVYVDVSELKKNKDKLEVNIKVE